LNEILTVKENFETPTVKIITHSNKIKAYSKNAIFVLQQEPDHKQTFYERFCQKDVVEQPCRFVEKKLHSQSHCVQQYSYSYAMVYREVDGRLVEVQDHIQVASGCACEVRPKENESRQQKPKRHSKVRHHPT